MTGEKKKKKRQQNLEYEFKNLEQRAHKTGEEGFKKIKACNLQRDVGKKPRTRQRKVRTYRKTI